MLVDDHGPFRLSARRLLEAEDCLAAEAGREQAWRCAAQPPVGADGFATPAADAHGPAAC